MAKTTLLSKPLFGSCLDCAVEQGIILCALVKLDLNLGYLHFVSFYINASARQTQTLVYLLISTSKKQRTCTWNRKTILSQQKYRPS